MYVKRMSESPIKRDETAGPSTSLRSGRDDNSVSSGKPRSQKRDLGHPLEIRPHHFLRSAAVLRLAQVWQGRCFCHDWRVGIELVLAAHHLARPRGV